MKSEGVQPPSEGANPQEQAELTKLDELISGAQKYIKGLEHLHEPETQAVQKTFIGKIASWKKDKKRILDGIKNRKAPFVSSDDPDNI